MPTRAPLALWIHGTHIATVSEAIDGRLSLAWTDDAIERWRPGTRIVSAKLPVGDPIPAPLVKNYIDGLLPEGNARVNHALAAGAPPDDTYALIRAYGLDTPGAAVFAPVSTDNPERVGYYAALDRTALTDRILRADQHSPAAGASDSSTLPGMVPKIVAHRDESGHWFSCKEGAPSTWIIKRGDSAGSTTADVIDTEVASLHLARRLGLTDIEAEILELDGTRAIAVSRYDRFVDESGQIGRWHQEDLAQAIGLNTADPNRKFQWGSKMPSLKHAAETLLAGGSSAEPLLRLVTFSTLLGNTDMHAKNIAFLRYDDGAIELSPAYDIAMHLHHSREGRRFALDVNGKYLVDAIGIDDIVAEARAWGLSERAARAATTRLAGELQEAIGALDKDLYPGVPEVAWEIVERRAAEAADTSTSTTAHTPKRRGPRVRQSRG